MKTYLLVLLTFVAFVAFSTTISVADLMDGMVGHWPLNGDALDTSGNGLNGTINGSVVPTTDRNGNADSAMQFAGASTDNISLGDPTELQFSGAMTLAAWVLVGDGMQGVKNGRIISKMAGGGSRSWSLNVENATLPAAVQISSDGGGIVEAFTEDSLPVGEWIHVAGVYTPGQSLQVYVNGELKAENTDSIPGGQFSTNGQPVLIGGRNACGDCGWLGSIDEVVAYDRVLSAAEVADLMDMDVVTAVKSADKLATVWGAMK